METPEPMPSINEPPREVCVYHKDAPELADVSLGDVVEFTVKGKVVGVRAADKMSDGETRVQMEQVDVQNVLKGGMDQGEEDSFDSKDVPSTDEAEKMSTSELRKKVPVKGEERY